MGIRITELFNADPEAGEPENINGNEIIVFDPDPLTTPVTSKGMSLTQLSILMASPIGIGVLQFSESTYATLEETQDVIVTIPVVRLKGSYQAVSVDWSLSGTAVENSHYSTLPTQGTLVFADGETIKNIEITIFANSLIAGDVTIILSFDAGTFLKEGTTPGVPDIVDGSIEGSLSSSTLTVTDDDITPAETIFNMTISNDTTIADIAEVEGIEYIAYYIKVDDDTAPLKTDPGFNDGPIPDTYTVADWDSHVYYLWVHDGTIVTQIEIALDNPNNDGDGGLVLQATISTPSNLSAFTLVPGVDPATQIIPTWTDSNIPILTLVSTELRHFTDDTIFRTGVISGTTISNVPTGTSLNLYPISLYANSATAQGNNASITTDASGKGTIGIKATTVRANNTGGYEVDEDGTNLQVTFEINNRPTNAGAVSFTWTVTGDTAVASTNFTATSANSETFPDNVNTDITVNIPVTDVDMSVNKTVIIQIDVGSETTGAQVDITQYDWGRGNSVLGYINGTAAGIEGFQATDDGDNSIVCWDWEDSNTTIVADSGDAAKSWDVLNQDSWDGVLPRSNPTRVKPNNSTIYGGLTEVLAACPHIDAKVYFPHAGTYYAHMRCLTGGSNLSQRVHMTLDNVVGNPPAGNGANLIEFDMAIYPDDLDLHGNHWCSTDYWSSEGQVGTRRSVVIPAPGQYTLSLYQYVYQFQADRVMFVANSGYDPATVGAALEPTSRNDNVGPELSTYSTGAVVVDDSQNLDFPPIATGATDTPDILSPVDGAGAVDTQVTAITAEFNSVINLTAVVMKLFKTTGDVLVTGTATVVGASNNIATWQPDAALIDGTAYYVTLTAFGENPVTGGAISIDFGSNTTDWNFTTDIASGEFVKQVTFDNWADGQLYNVEQIEADWRTMPWLTGNTFTNDPSRPDHEIIIVADPANNPARGNVLRIKWYPELTKNHIWFYHHFNSGNYNIFPDTGGSNLDKYPLSNEANGTTGNPGSPPIADAIARESVGGRYNELHMAYDMYFDPNWQYLNYHKLPGMVSGTPLQASHGQYAEANKEGYYGCNMAMTLAGHEWGAAVPPGALAWYRYDMNRVQDSRRLNINDPTISANLAQSDFYIVPLGKWFTIEIRAKLNTAGVNFTTDSTRTSSLWTIAAEALGLPDDEFHMDDYVAAEDLYDGLVEIWIMEEDWSEAKLMLTRAARFRAWEYLKLTQGYIRSYNNDNPATNDSLPNQTQYFHFDNFRFKTSAILPR